MIQLDVFEPTDLEELIAQVAPVNRMALNSMGYADVLIHAFDAHTIQIENKRAEELLSSGLDRVERQLRRQYDKANENMLLIRGMVAPRGEGVAVYHESSSKSVWYKRETYSNPSYGGYRAWLWSLDKLGITCIEVPSLLAAATAIVTIYHQAQKAEHQTMRRYIKQKIRLEEPNPYVETLMGLRGANLGEKTAKQLIDVFGSPWAVFCRSHEELAEVVGSAMAGKVLKAIGRL